MEIIQDFIKKGAINRPASINSCTYITIHETANTSKGATARAHASYVKSVKERVSWHYSVDSTSIYQHLPDEEKSFHTSSSEANENAISIELCVNSDGDFEATKENAVWLVKTLLTRHNIPPKNITAHKDWTGKTCPATLLKSGWDEFLARCRSEEGEKKYITIDALRQMGYVGMTF